MLSYLHYKKYQAPTIRKKKKKKKALKGNQMGISEITVLVPIQKT